MFELKNSDKAEGSLASCPSTKQLFNLVRGSLRPQEAAHFGAHLDAGCAECRHQFHRLKKLVAVTARRELLDPPDWLRQQAQHLYSWYRTRPSEPQIEHLPAVLVVSSLADERLLGFRCEKALSRQMLYRGGGLDIDISIDYIEPAQRVDIVGQSISSSADVAAAAKARVRLLNGTHVIVNTQTNEYSEFIIEGVREGFYSLQLQLRDKQLDIVGLNAIFRTS